jgi:hypothetical protein
MLSVSVKSGKNEVEERLVRIASLMESLVSEFYTFAKIVESGEDSEKSLGYRHRVYPTNRVSNEQSKTRLKYADGNDIEKDIQKQTNSERLVSEVLKGNVRCGEIAKRLKNL